MRRTGILADLRFLEHETGPHHPESPERLAVLHELLSGADYDDCARLDPRPATEEELRGVHSHDHVAAVAASSTRGETWFDADTPASHGSFAAARLAAGGAVEMADAIVSGEIENGFAALRPPGHHAEASRPMGFCLFNNAAVVARHLVEKRGIARVLVVDWDVHHGNGTQDIFYGSPEVLYVSTHQYPFYPGTGSAVEIGRGGGAGFNMNVPMPAGAGPAEFRAAFRDLVLPVVEEFEPGFVLVSAGFDAHRDDPLASLALDAATYGELTDALVGVADQSAKGRLLMLLEGGYDLRALRDSVAETVAHLRCPGRFSPTDGELTAWGRRCREALSAHWGRI